VRAGWGMMRATPSLGRIEENPEMLAAVLVALVALLHFYFLVLEMFLWDKPLGLKTFRNTPEKAELTKVLAANQGLYNGFLAAGLLWGLSLGAAGAHVQAFFLICVVVAGAYGAYSVSRRIFFVQALPALLALAALYFGV
jgi:putative membrane protein